MKYSTVSIRVAFLVEDESGWSLFAIVLTINTKLPTILIGHNNHNLGVHNPLHTKHHQRKHLVETWGDEALITTKGVPQHMGRLTAA